MPPHFPAGGRSRQILAAATVAVLLLGLVGCGDGGSVAGPTDAQADSRYGAAPVAHPDVTYQPDVILVGGGGGTVRSVTDGGLTWRLDPKARGADKLAVGKVMFVTGRGVGRVVNVQRDGGDLAVTVGPVDITEVIRDGTFAAEQPVSLSAAVPYDAGQPFWADTDAVTDGGVDDGGVGGGGVGGGIGDTAGGGSRMPGRLARLGHASVAAGMNVTPICCSGGVGARFSYDDGGTRFVGTATLLMNKPSASFHLSISGGTVTRAELQVTGGAGLRVEIEAATQVGNERNIRKRVPIPVDFSVPIGQILGVPFSATVNQWLIVQTAFSAKDAHIKAAGEYSFGGTLGFGYANGSFGPQVPQRFQTRDSLTDSITGVSIGVSGVIVSYQAKFYVGIGAFGFTAGLYFGLTASVGITNGSSIGLVVCRGVKLDLLVNYGVGYTIPAPVTAVINFFLKTFRTRPIQNTGGIGSTTRVFSRQEVLPKVALCQS